TAGAVVQLREAATGQPVSGPLPHAPGRPGLTFSPDGLRMAVPGGAELSVVEAGTGRTRLTLEYAPPGPRHYASAGAAAALAGGPLRPAVLAEAAPRPRAGEASNAPAVAFLPGGGHVLAAGGPNFDEPLFLLGDLATGEVSALPVKLPRAVVLAL